MPDSNSPGVYTDAPDSKWSPQVLIRQAERSHRRLPGIRKIPLRAIAIILFIALLNVLVWIAAAVVLVSLYFPPEYGIWLMMTALLSVCPMDCFIL